MRSYGVIEKSLDNLFLVFREKKRFHKIKTAHNSSSLYPLKISFNSWIEVTTMDRKLGIEE